MSEKEKHIKSYSGTDIRNYLEGKLSSAEMHALEKAAMDDPLLADAIEGIEMSDQQVNVSFESGAAELRKRLKERINQEEKKNRILPMMLKWQVAAAIIFLTGAGTLTYQFLIKKPEAAPHISLNREKTKAADTLNQNDNFPVPPEPDSSSLAINNKSNPKQPALRKERTANSKKKSGAGSGDKTSPDKETVSGPEASSIARSEPREFSTSIPVNKKNADSSFAPAVALQGKVAGIAIRGRSGFSDQERRAQGFYLQGIVTDSNGVPIPDATVNIKNKKEGTRTDLNGTFKLKTDFPDSSQDVLVNSVGYQPASVSISPSANSDKLIQLKPAANALNDVVVIGYGAARKKDDADDEYAPAPDRRNVIIQKAEPVIGWAAYNDYIDKNKKINSADSLLKGTEIVSFLVNKKGELSSFKMEKSISPVHDAALIRLIKDGPAWKLLKGNKHRCRLSVNFK